MAPQKPEPPFESILASKPFKFLVGANKKEYSLHKSAVARLSTSLDMLLNGRMKEAKEHCVSWEDTDEKTFIRFAEWAYTGSYTPEEPEILLDASQIASSKHDVSVMTEEEPESLLTLLKRYEYGPEQHCGLNWTGDQWEFACQVCSQLFLSSRCAKCRLPQYANCEKCDSHDARKSPRHRMMKKFAEGGTRSINSKIRLARAIKESCEDFTEVFLSHARLYVLADKYDIPKLQDECVENLHVVLLKFRLYKDRVGDVLKLLRYTFVNTVVNDKLRSLVVGYCACFIKEVTTSDDFEEVADATPDFACQLLRDWGKYMQ